MSSQIIKLTNAILIIAFSKEIYCNENKSISFRETADYKESDNPEPTLQSLHHRCY